MWLNVNFVYDMSVYVYRHMMHVRVYIVAVLQVPIEQQWLF